MIHAHARDFMGRRLWWVTAFKHKQEGRATFTVPPCRLAKRRCSLPLLASLSRRSPGSSTSSSCMIWVKCERAEMRQRRCVLAGRRLSATKPCAPRGSDPREGRLVRFGADSRRQAAAGRQQAASGTRGQGRARSTVHESTQSHANAWQCQARREGHASLRGPGCAAPGENAISTCVTHQGR